MSGPVILPGRVFVVCRKRKARLLSQSVFFFAIHNIFFTSILKYSAKVVESNSGVEAKERKKRE